MTILKSAQLGIYSSCELHFSSSYHLRGEELHAGVASVLQSYFMPSHGPSDDILELKSRLFDSERVMMQLSRIT